MAIEVIETRNPWNSREHQSQSEVTHYTRNQRDQWQSNQPLHEHLFVFPAKTPHQFHPKEQRLLP